MSLFRKIVCVIGYARPRSSILPPIPSGRPHGRNAKPTEDERAMKVVLFCGGQGMRLREMPEPVPKPMAPIGYRPLLWHLMKYYAHYGHHDFVLCLGYRADVIKEYFLNYDECVSNDFVLSSGGSNIELLRADIADWRITFVDTGLKSNVGQRLLRVQRYVEGEEIFLANYADGLTDLPLDRVIEHFRSQKKSPVSSE
jgi:glucose-1-phosphate cytidylyltransferase